MKRIPKSIPIMGHRIAIHVIPRNRWSFEDCVGLFDPSTNNIYVLKQSKSQTAHSFWHEVTHAMLFYMSHRLYTNEQFVDQLGGMISQILAGAE